MKVYKAIVIESLRDLSNYEFQKIAWFENNQNLSSSYIDDVNAVFDDSGLGHALDGGEVVFGQVADEALRDLDEATNTIDEFSLSDAKIINMSEMQIVREKAAKALALINASTGEGSTVEIVE